jgi:hypothetical protein
MWVNLVKNFFSNCTHIVMVYTLWYWQGVISYIKIFFAKIYIKDHKRKWTSILLLLLISISYMKETIPKLKRPFLCLKIHSYTPKIRPFPYTFVVFLSWPFRDVNKIFLHVLRGIQIHYLETEMDKFVIQFCALLGILRQHWSYEK